MRGSLGSEIRGKFGRIGYARNMSAFDKVLIIRA